MFLMRSEILMAEEIWESFNLSTRACFYLRRFCPFFYQERLL